MGKQSKDEISKTENETNNKCRHCNRIFPFQCSLQKHMRIHSGERPYKCEEEGCNQTFSQVSNLIRHSRIHTGIKPYQCKLCKKCFTSSSNLKQHRNIHENSHDRPKLTCFIKDCNKSYLYVCTLKKHIMLTHKKEYKIINENYDKINFSDVIQILKAEGDKYNFVYFKPEENFKELSNDKDYFSHEKINYNVNVSENQGNLNSNINNNPTNNNNTNNFCNTLEQILRTNQQFDYLMKCVNMTTPVNVNSKALTNLNNFNLFPIINIGNPRSDNILNNDFFPYTNNQNCYDYNNNINLGMYNMSSNNTMVGSNIDNFPHNSASLLESFNNLVRFMNMNPFNNK